MKATREEMLEYAAGRSDPATAERLLNELEDPESEASGFVNEMAALAEKGPKVDWRRLLTFGGGGECAQYVSEDPDARNADTMLKVATLDRRRGDLGRRRRLLAWAPVAAAVMLIATVALWVIWGNKDTKAITLLKKDLTHSQMQLAMVYKEEFLRESTLKKDLADSKMQLAMVYKEEFLAESASPVRSYWSMNTSPQTLDLTQVRGSEKPSARAEAIAARAVRILGKLAELSEEARPALLEQVSLETALGQFDNAKKRLDAAESLLGATPDVRNLRAVLCLAQGGENATKQAEKMLREIIHDYPDYAPAWYNLALLLEYSYQDVESRKCWKEFLRIERRPEYRKVAGEHLREVENQ